MEYTVDGQKFKVVLVPVSNDIAHLLHVDVDGKIVRVPAGFNVFIKRNGLLLLSNSTACPDGPCFVVRRDTDYVIRHGSQYGYIVCTQHHQSLTDMFGSAQAPAGIAEEADAEADAAAHARAAARASTIASKASALANAHAIRAATLRQSRAEEEAIVRARSALDEAIAEGGSLPPTTVRP